MSSKKCEERKEEGKRVLKTVVDTIGIFCVLLIAAGMIGANVILWVMFFGDGIQYRDEWLILPILSTVHCSLWLGYEYIKGLKKEDKKKKEVD